MRGILKNFLILNRETEFSVVIRINPDAHEGVLPDSRAFTTLVASVKSGLKGPLIVEMGGRNALYSAASFILDPKTLESKNE